MTDRTLTNKTAWLVFASAAIALSSFSANAETCSQTPCALQIAQAQTTNQETTDMTAALPAPLKAAIDAINNADTDAFVAAFAANGVVNDWGRVLRGHEGARSWANSDAIGAGAQMTVVEASTTGDVTHITFDWKSRVFNGRSQAYVTVTDGLISEFRIPSH